MGGEKGPLSLREVLEQEFDAIHGACSTDPCDRRKVPEPDGRSGPPLAEFCRRIATDAPARSALCLSGGGIRSASFGLGILQGLAQRRILARFDYLSTVSGGGYIGGWLTAWVHRSAGQIAPVQEQLRPPACPFDAGCRDSAGIEAAPIRHLREYSNYLTPRLGLFSLDSWTLLATYLRNLFLNWLVLMPLLVGILMLPRIYAALFWLEPPDQWWHRWVLMGIWGAANIMAAVWLPSKGVRLGAPARHPGPNGQESRKGNRWIFATVLLPILVVSCASVVRRAWPRAEVGHWERIFYVVGLYAFCAVASVLLILSRRWLFLRREGPAARPRAPKVTPAVFLKTFLLFALIGLATFALMLLVAEIPFFKLPLVYPRFATCFGPPLMLGVYLFTVALFVGLTSRDRHPDADEDREWWARLMGFTLIMMVGWIVVTGISLYGPVLVRGLGELDASGLWNAALISGSAITGLIGVLGARSPRSGPVPAGEGKTAQRFLEAMVSISARVFLFLFLVLLASGMDAALERVRREYRLGSATVTYERHAEDPWHGPPPLYLRRPDAAVPAVLGLAGIAAGCFAFAFFFGSLINVNRFSLHAVFRSRLVRAYLGASNRDRRQHPFTGFDPDDNVPLHRLRSGGLFTPEQITDPLALADLWLKESAWDDFQGPALRYVRNRLSPLDPFCSKVEAARDKDPQSDEMKGLRAALTDHLNLMLTESVEDGLPKESRLGPDVRQPARPYPDWLKGAHARRLETVQQAWNEHNHWKELTPDGSDDVLAGVDLLNAKILLSVCYRTDERKPGLVPLLEGPPLLPKPFHVINVSLNLVGGKNLAWQHRKATSFIMSPLHCGFEKGYRHSVEYAQGISLGTAVAISGAAASPNMGYHSSPAVTFLMTLFNIRLGWWLGNPSKSPAPRGFLGRLIEQYGVPTPPYELSCPQLSVRPIVDEALGRTTDENDYVYLSDGGHFDNLGLYEMVRRRCRLIVVCDASCDGEYNFEDLGNAIRKIRIDLGIPISMDEMHFRSDPGTETISETNPKGCYCAVGRVFYENADGADAPPGMIVYLKPKVRGRESADVYNYWRTSSKRFPHESTSDQWFSEAQFESYRQLGLTVIGSICKDGTDKSLVEFFDLAAKHCESSLRFSEPATLKAPVAERESQPSPITVKLQNEEVLDRLMQGLAKRLRKGVGPFLRSVDHPVPNAAVPPPSEEKPTLG